MWRKSVWSIKPSQCVIPASWQHSAGWRGYCVLLHVGPVCGLLKPVHPICKPDGGGVYICPWETPCLRGNGCCVRLQTCAEASRRSHLLFNKAQSFGSSVCVEHFLKSLRNPAVHPERGRFTWPPADRRTRLSLCPGWVVPCFSENKTQRDFSGWL